ncbi:RraA family protein [Streptomyces canus]|uniref:RraA family protein n=1 Tax=Streptomyces canus TaxID=58343 RepID=UPI0033AEC95E
MYINASADNCQVHTSWHRPDRQLVAALSVHPTANVGDALDRFGLAHSTVRALMPGARCAGPALTVLTREGDVLAVHRALDEAQPGDVLVINGRGDEARAVFGDLMAEICLAKGVVGVVIDGVTRDVQATAELGLPVWARGSTPAGPTKTGPGFIGLPVAVGGVVVNPGDIVVADGDGVAVVPQDRAAAVVDRLGDIERLEDALRARIRTGEAAAG